MAFMMAPQVAYQYQAQFAPAAPTIGGGCGVFGAPPNGVRAVMMLQQAPHMFAPCFAATAPQASAQMMPPSAPMRPPIATAMATSPPPPPPQRSPAMHASASRRPAAARSAPQQSAALVQQQLPAAQQQRKAKGSSIALSELTAALESLYNDQLKPYGRILRKRLAERAQAEGKSDAEVSIKDLRAACESCPWLEVQQDTEGADWAVLLQELRPAFVDVYSPQDVYPPELWEQAAKYFEGLCEDEMVLPGGRYSCAQVLVQRRLPFLAGRSLGQICHIVQLAISQKKLLGYLNGTVVPYGRSASMVKEKNAECQRPCLGASSRGRSDVADWETVRSCLRSLLDGLGPGEQFLPLSNIKRLFRANFQVELSETALGYAKLSELLQDHRLQDMCEIRLRGHGYVILPLKAGPPKKKSLISLSDSLCMEAPAPSLPPPAKPICEPPAARSASGGGGLLRRRAGAVSPLTIEEIEPEASPEQAPAPWPQAGNGSSSATPARALFPPTPSPCSVDSRSRPAAADGVADRALPRLLGSIRTGPQALFGGASWKDATKAISSPLAGAKRAIVGVPAPSPAMLVRSPAQARLLPAPATLVGTPPARRVAEVAPVRTWSAARPLTPSTLGSFGFSVHNTFIHAVVPPPTPMQAGARHRSMSLPRDS